MKEVNLKPTGFSRIKLCGDLEIDSMTIHEPGGRAIPFEVIDSQEIKIDFEGEILLRLLKYPFSILMTTGDQLFHFNEGSSAFRIQRKGSGSLSNLIDKLKIFVAQRPNILTILQHPLLPDELLIEGNLSYSDRYALRALGLRENLKPLPLDLVTSLFAKRISDTPSFNPGDKVELLSTSFKGEQGTILSVSEAEKIAKVALVEYLGEIILEISFKELYLIERNEENNF